MPRARDWLLVPLLPVVAAVGIVWGGRATMRTIANGSPREMTCAEFLAQPPDADWVRLDGCVPASDRIGIETSGTRAKAVYVPLTAGPRTGDRVTLVLHADGGPLLALASKFPSERESEAAREVLGQPIEGLVERSLDRSERDRKKLRGLGLNLAEDFLIIDHGARPRPLWLGLGVLGIGLGALALLVRKWRRRTRPVSLAKAKLVAG